MNQAHHKALEALSLLEQVIRAVPAAYKMAACWQSKRE
jgi:hypothetical protein